MNAKNHRLKWIQRRTFKNKINQNGIFVIHSDFNQEEDHIVETFCNAYECLTKWMELNLIQLENEDYEDENLLIHFWNQSKGPGLNYWVEDKINGNPQRIMYYTF